MSSPQERAEQRAAKAAEYKQQQAAKPRAALPPRPKKLAPTDLRLPGDALTAFVALVPDEDFELALSSRNYFGNVTGRLHRMDRITILNKSGTREADAIVLGLNEHGGEVELFVRQTFEYPASAIGQNDLDALYAIRDTGFAGGYEIVRKSDGAVMAKGIKTFDQALQERRGLHANRIAA
jgi:hypothetical protein